MKCLPESEYAKLLSEIADLRALTGVSNPQYRVELVTGNDDQTRYRLCGPGCTTKGWTGAREYLEDLAAMLNEAVAIGRASGKRIR